MTSETFPILWLTGNSGAGKSTVAFAAQKHFNETLEPGASPYARRVVVLDGDEMRATISTEEDLSPEGRRAHNLRVARLAAHLQGQGFLVLVSVIAPFAAVREELNGICNPKWIYVKREGLESEEKPYEAPENPALTIDNDTSSPEESLEALLQILL